MKLNKRSLLFGFVIGIASLGLLAAVSNFDALQLDSYLTVGTYQTIGSYQTVGAQQTIGTYSLVGSEVRSPEHRLGSGTTADSTGRIVMVARNKSGAVLHRGRVVTWDTVQVKWDSVTTPFAAYTDTAGTLASEGMPIGLKYVVWGTPSNDSIYIYGVTLSSDGVTHTATTEIALLNVANDTRYSNYIWSGIDSVVCDSGAATAVDSVLLYIDPFKGVIMGGAGALFAAGVVVSDSIIDNGVGDICVYGETQVRVKTGSGTYIRSGWPLSIGASGTALPLAAAQLVTDSLALNYTGTIVGHGVGGKDDVSDSTTIWIFVDLN